MSVVRFGLKHCADISVFFIKHTLTIGLGSDDCCLRLKLILKLLISRGCGSAYGVNSLPLQFDNTLSE